MANLNALGGSFRSLPPKKIISLIAATVFIIALTAVLYAWIQKSDYQPLYTNLSEEDAGQIIQKLAELKVPYVTTPGGIMVPADKVYELRIQLASHGIPLGGAVGFELFDKTSYTMSDFAQKLNFRRALQGELSRTIRSLSEVASCRVHLAVPDKSLFVQKEERPKASVLVKLRAGKRLSPAQVQGIVHLVSSSVEGLDPRDVSVIDSRGEALTAPADDTMAASSSQLEYQHAYEKDLEARVIAILEPVAGAGKVRAKAAVTMDFTKIEKTEERFDPDSQVVRSEQRTAEKASSSGGGGGGVPGVTSNLPAKPAQPPAISTTHQSQSDKKNETINYEISKIVSRVVVPAGSIKRLSVVALVDSPSPPADAGEKKSSARSEEDLRQYEELVKKAVGFTAERGDEVKIVNLPFEAAESEEAGEAPAEPSAFAPVAIAAMKYLLPLAAIVLLFFFVVRPLMKFALTPAPTPAVPTPAVQLPQTVAELERTMERKQISSRDQLITWAKQNPTEASNLVKGWLEER